MSGSTLEGGAVIQENQKTIYGVSKIGMPRRNNKPFKWLVAPQNMVWGFIVTLQR